MTVVTVDYETYWDQDYSLRKMSEVEYILDPRYQTIMAAIQEGRGPWEMHIGHEAVAARLDRIDWENAAFLSHNARFDGSILSWHFGHTPKLYLDTLSMARALTAPVAGGNSLEKVSQYLGLPPKGDEVLRSCGKRLESFLPDELQAYADYCVRDAQNCRAIFDKFMEIFPIEELDVVDIFQRMFIQPQALLNPHKLAENLAYARALKEQALAQVAHVDRSVFSSNQKFAALLGQYTDVPKKRSPITGEEIPALAKNDYDFKELCADENQPPIVQALLAARLGVKSTIEETRTVTLLNLAQRPWKGSSQPGWMPVPYRYYGAHTGRPSGDGGFNFTNLRRKSPLRDAIEAPTGYRIVHRDSSQIEARMVAWLAGCRSLLHAFHDGRDIYSEFAGHFYGGTVTKADAPKRFVGKTCILGLGYGMGAERLRHTLFIGAGGVSMTVTEETARALVMLYREMYQDIPRLWYKGDELLQRMTLYNQAYAPQLRTSPELESWGRTTNAFPTVVKEGWDAVWLPNRLCIAYPKIRTEMGDKGRMEIGYTGPYKEFRRLFGGKLVENVSQALARIVITDVMRRVRAATGYHPCLMTYDSLDYVVPESDASTMDGLLEYEFMVVPEWASGLPLASEGGWGRTLLAAEERINE